MYIYKCWRTTGVSTWALAIFFIYVNDVAENMISLYGLFADDNSLQYKSYNVANIEYTLNHGLNLYDRWSSKWLLNFNPSVN